MNILDILGNETALSVILSIAGALWTVIRASTWYTNLKDQKYSKAVECLEGGVQVAYQTYVQAIKDAKGDGKLTVEEVALARKKATEAAMAFGASRGIDVAAQLGEAYIGIWIEKLIAKLKGAPKMPDSVAGLLP